jgi:hypothetical protein
VRVVIQKAKAHLLKSYSTIAIQKVNVTEAQYNKLKEITSSPSAPSCGSCMHAVFRALQVAEVPIKAPSFPVNQLSDVSRTYLQKTRAQGKNPLLGKIRYFGKITQANDNGWKRYLKNVVVAPGLFAALSTGIVLNLPPVPRLTRFPDSSMLTVSAGLGLVAAVWTAYVTQKNFSNSVNDR